MKKTKKKENKQGKINREKETERKEKEPERKKKKKEKETEMNNKTRNRKIKLLRKKNVTNKSLKQQKYHLRDYT